MWTQDWLRCFRSGKIVSVELTGRHDAAIANRQSTLEDAGFEIVVYDDEETDFLIVRAGHCKQLSNVTNASHIEVAQTGSRYENDPQQLVEDCEETFVPRASAHSMEVCGRGDHNHAFQDLRSASRAIKRDGTTRQKYYDFKHVKPGDVEARSCESVDTSDENSERPPAEKCFILTKSELYRQAQLPPRPPRYHRRHLDKIYGTLSQRVDVRREARKHSKAILKDQLRDW